MAQINDLTGFGGIGILHPVIQNQWRLSFTGSKKVVQTNSILSEQTTHCRLDMKNNKAFISIEQSTVALEYYQLENLNYDFFSMRIDALDGSNNTHYALMFSGCKILKHEHNFDYAESGALCHELEVEYMKYEVYIPVRQEKVGPEPTNVD